MMRFLHLLLIAAAGLGVSATLRADPLSDLNDARTLLNRITPDAVKTFGFATEYRAYEPATSLMSAGRRFDIGVDATLIRFPDDFKNTLADSGFGSLGIGFLPMFKGGLTMGLGQSMDIGVSGLFYPNLITTLGGGAKFVLYHPEQGITWALRTTYTYTYFVGSGVIQGADMIFDTHTANVHVLASRKLHFADPYIGLGYQYAVGTVTVPVDLGPLGTTEEKASGRGGAIHAFLGVGFVMGPGAGVKLTLEGSWSQYTAHTIGAKLGLTL